MENYKAKAIKHQIDFIRDKINFLTKQINELHNELNEVCTHEDTKKVESFISSRHIEKTEFITTTFCKICGKTLDREVKYGGFG